jgi:hypothetical protein
VFLEPDEEHWHGAAPNHFMTYILRRAGPLPFGRGRAPS